MRAPARRIVPLATTLLVLAGATLARAQCGSGQPCPGGSSDSATPERYAEPLQVEAAILWDNNVNRARDADDRLADHFLNLRIGKGAEIPIAEHARALVSGFADADKFARYPGLDRLSLGGQVELQYRASGDFGTPIIGFLGRLAADDYPGTLRSDYRYALGVTLRQSLTDRIDLFAALTANRRRAQSTVFDGSDAAARFNLNYALGDRGAIYVGGEYRRGDIVISVPPDPEYQSLAKASAPDPAFGSDPHNAYRYEATTTLWTLGYNFRVGENGALDLSIRHASSKPTASTNQIYTSSSPYTVNQYAIAYLTRF